MNWNVSHDYNEDLVLTEVLEVNKSGDDHNLERIEVKVKGNLEVTLPGFAALYTYGTQGVRSVLYVNSDKNKTVKIDGKILQRVDSEIYVNFSNSDSYLTGEIDVAAGSIEFSNDATWYVPNNVSLNKTKVSGANLNFWQTKPNTRPWFGCR